MTTSPRPSPPAISTCTADAVYLVTILPQSPDHKLAADVTVLSKLFGLAPLGTRGESLALAILQDGAAGPLAEHTGEVQSEN